MTPEDGCFPGQWVRIMCDPGGDVVWDRDGAGLDHELLPIPDDLKHALDDWGDRCPGDGWMPLHARDHPAVLYEAYALEGLALAQRVKDALPNWTVFYHDEARVDFYLGRDRIPFLEDELTPGQHVPEVEPWRLETHHTLPSTSDMCTERARNGEPGGLAVQALRQTAGRGSRGRSWDTPENNLALSVLLRPDGRYGSETARSGQWALAAAVALRQGLTNFDDHLTIKWPNDVLQHGRKVAGLLVDVAVDGPALSWVVLGMGANLCSAPSGFYPSPSMLGAHDPGHVAACVLDRLSTVLRIWRDHGFEPIRQLWLARAHPVGTPLHVRSARHDVSGTFAGLSPDGALLLDTPDGVRTFSTGEVLLA